jgi:hypothetical protein
MTDGLRRGPGALAVDGDDSQSPCVHPGKIGPRNTSTDHERSYDQGRSDRHDRPLSGHSELLDSPSEAVRQRTPMINTIATCGSGSFGGTG